VKIQLSDQLDLRWVGLLGETRVVDVLVHDILLVDRDGIFDVIDIDLAVFDVSVVSWSRHVGF
jgi:hypothetical protein